MDIRSCRLDMHVRNHIDLIIDIILHTMCFVFYTIPSYKQNMVGNIFFVVCGTIFLLISWSKFRKMKSYKDIMK